MSLSLTNHTSHITHTLESVTVKLNRVLGGSSSTRLCSAAGSVCALWFSQLGLLPNFTLAHYKLTTIPPPHLASGTERGRGTPIMATQWSVFLFTELKRGGVCCRHSKQLKERERSGIKKKGQSAKAHKSA